MPGWQARQSAFCWSLAPRLLPDPDTYSQIALGRWILENWTVLSVDPISGTMRGAPWIAFEWLSEVALATAYNSALGPAWSV